MQALSLSQRESWRGIYFYARNKIPLNPPFSKGEIKYFIVHKLYTLKAKMSNIEKRRGV